MKNIKRIFPLLLAFIMVFALSASAFAASKGVVTIKYVTGENNKQISKSKTMSGTPGKHFSVKVPTIKGYTYIGFTDSVDNDFTYPEKSMTVLVHYAKSVSATINYLDTYGNVIAKKTTVSGSEGQSYTVATPYISGYSLMQIQDPENGVFGHSNHTINVYYSAGSIVPAATSSVQLTIQSVDRDTNGVLQTLLSQQVMLPRTINFSAYSHTVPGYTFIGTMVNGIMNYNSSVTLTGNTTINFLYTKNQPWPSPIAQYATLTVTAVDADTGSVISVLRCENVPAGTNVSINPPAMNGYAYDHTEVNGNLGYTSSVTVNYDTDVDYYYHMLYLQNYGLSQQDLQDLQDLKDFQDSLEVLDYLSSLSDSELDQLDSLLQESGDQ